MNYVQLYAKYPTGSTGDRYQEIELYETEPIKITKSIQQVEEPQLVSSNFSRTFKVPNTPGNGQFFKGVFNVNNQTYDAQIKVPAYIMVNGVSFVGGNIRLNQIFYNGKMNLIDYELIFMGETSNFSSVVSPKNLSETDLSGLTHEINYDNITKSWDLDLFNGDVVYPLAEYGYTYDPSTKQPIQNTLSVYGGTAGSKGFTSSLHPISVSQFKPMIRAQYIWKKIFEQAGFTYESDFLDNSPLFTSLYYFSTSQYSSGAITESPKVKAQMNPNSNQFWQSQYWQRLQFPAEIFDNNNNWDPVNSVYMVISPAGASAGMCVFKMSNMTLSFSAAASPTPSPVCEGRFFEFELRVNGNSYVTSAAWVDAQSCGPVRGQTSPVYSGNPAMGATGTEFIWYISGLTGGDVVDFYVRSATANDGAGIEVGTFNTGLLEISCPSFSDPTGYLPTQYKQIDFIRGITDKFKLMWEPDEFNPRNFKIEPWNEWIKRGVQKDWTDKLDQGQDVSITPLFQTQPRRIIFKDSSEADLYNFSYEQQNKQIFGQLNQDSNLEILTGDREITTIFAPVPIAPIGNANNFLIPHFAKDTENERQPIQVKPRLMFYNGKVTAPYNWYLLNDSNVSTVQYTYPLASPFNSYPFGESVYDVDWTNVPQFWNETYNLSAGNGRTGVTNFTAFWQNWYDFTYSSYGRMLDATFALTYRDIYNLHFNDRIFIKDSWWLPIEVKDYALSPKEKVKVRLVKLGDDVGVSTTGDSTIYFKHTGFYYWTSGCDACCVSNQPEIFLYTDSPILENSTRAYFDSNGLIPASVGGFSNLKITMSVNSPGIIAGFVSCCDCTCSDTVLYAFCAAVGTSRCNVCCAQPGQYDNRVYGNNSDWDFNTTLSKDALGLVPLEPGKWYKDGYLAHQIGPDGFTIVDSRNCNGCQCPV